MAEIGRVLLLIGAADGLLHATVTRHSSQPRTVGTHTKTHRKFEQIWSVSKHSQNVTLHIVLDLT